MSQSSTDPAAQSLSEREGPVDWTDLGAKMWSFLTGREAAINYRFIDMSVEVPRDTGNDSPRATWKLDGTLQITTNDNQSSTD